MNTERKPLSAEVLDKIQSEDIKPLPRWRFLLPRVVFWMVTALSIVLGSHIVAATLSILLDLNGDLPGVLPILVFLRAGAATLPLLWIILMLVLVLIATLVIRTTGRGYRFPIGRILAGTILATIVIGSGLYAAGERPPIEPYLGAGPLGGSIMERHAEFWTHPEEGRIMGRIESLSGTTAVLRTRDETVHTLIFPHDGRGLPPFVRSGSVIRATGELDGPVFRVEELLPDRPVPRGFRDDRDDFFRHGDRGGMQDMRSNMMNMESGHGVNRSDSTAA
ncbi:MAG TPA: hypothetical protein PK765_07175 [bacterium]|nr:hypothetical protein [bacterium]